MKTARYFAMRASMLFALAGALLAPSSLRACAACYGQSDSPLAAAMNWGIFSLLGFIVVVLGGVAAFGVFLARKSAAHAQAQQLLEQAEFDAFSSVNTLERGSGLKDQRSALARRRHNCRTVTNRRETVPLHR